MGDLAVALLGIVLVSQYALPLIPALRDEPGAPGASLGEAAATGVVLVVSLSLAFGIRAGVLDPLGLPELRFVALALVAGAMTTLGGPLLGRILPAPGHAVSAATARLTFNAIALGAAVLATRAPGTLAGTVAWGGAAATGFALLNACFAGIRDRLEAGDVPEVLRGEAIALVTAGIVCLALGGLAGVVRG